MGISVGGAAFKAGADATGLTDKAKELKDNALYGVAKAGQKIGLGKFQKPRQKGMPIQNNQSEKNKEQQNNNTNSDGKNDTNNTNNETGGTSRIIGANEDTNDSTKNNN
jgi:hypothetical protein